MVQRRAFLGAAAVCLSLGLSVVPAAADDAAQVLTIDHFIPHVSTVPAIAGQSVQLYARERVQAGRALRSPVGASQVALFVHGAGTPAEVGFDAPYADYS